MPPRFTDNIDDLRLPGTVAELSPEEAAQQGSFEEDAVTADEAEAANIDLAGEVDDGER